MWSRGFAGATVAITVGASGPAEPDDGAGPHFALVPSTDANTDQTVTLRLSG